ncbi:hypothetical protein ACF07L_37245 [Streptomyces anulatus]|uniref:hypothetical protein n=1 Tax=Streptomyces anulatus TaxID=1892 RepID=UPI003702EB91
MTISHLPAPAGPADDVPSYEPWEGQTAVLAGARVAGRRAAAWVRSLPVPPLPVPVGGWLAGELPDAIETAMCSFCTGSSLGCAPSWTTPHARTDPRGHPVSCAAEP